LLDRFFFGGGKTFKSVIPCLPSLRPSFPPFFFPQGTKIVPPLFFLARTGLLCFPSGLPKGTQNKVVLSFLKASQHLLFWSRFPVFHRPLLFPPFFSWHKKTPFFLSKKSRNCAVVGFFPPFVFRDGPTFSFFPLSRGLSLAGPPLLVKSGAPDGPEEPFLAKKNPSGVSKPLFLFLFFWG